MNRPDPDQQAVIDIDSGYHLVLAPPGCGKTYILTERVIQSHQRGVDYGDMLCLTFTNRAAHNMRDRIATSTGNPVPPTLFVGNVHRFCSQYLFENNKIPQNSAIIDDIDSESIISHLARLSPDEDHLKFTQDIVNLQHALSQQQKGMPRELIVHADLLDTAARPEMKRRVQIAKAYAEYKETDNLLDFEDLLEKTYFYALEEQESLHKYSWIQVDEVQDLNHLQIALLDLFSAKDKVVVYLGDEQQAIFSFVGAKLDTLDHLRTRCQGHIHHLGRNHRSPQYLLDAFNAYATRQLGLNPELLPTTTDSTRPKPQDLCLFKACYHNLGALYNKEHLFCQTDLRPCTLCQRPVADEHLLAVRLARRYAALDDRGRVAIIVPTNADADRISRAFGDTPHFKISGRDIFSTPSMQVLLAHFNVVANETCFIAWARLLFHLGIVAEYPVARNLMRSLRGYAISPTDLLIYDRGTYLQQFVAAYDTEELVIFDTETTGLDVFNDDIIQIAAIKVRNGQLVPESEFEVILETERDLPPIVGGHENPMLAVYRDSQRLSRAEGLQRFMDYCHGHTLVGHNIEFDYHILEQNLLRTLGRDLNYRDRFDTLKLTRLVRPRMRSYKLVRLLEALHLDGVNSHNAIDDVRATLSLLNYCRQASSQYLGPQRDLLSNPDVRSVASRFRERYKELYLHTCQQLYKRQAPQSGKLPLLVDEMQQLYLKLLAQGHIKPIDKWRHIVDYLALDLVQPQFFPSLKEQLEKYIVELNTCRESDLCDSASMRREGQERYFIATAHKAKGLEFENVIVFNAAEGSYPFYFNIRNNDQEHIREDARRFYVAITRAKRRLCITFANTDSRACLSRPSRFLEPLMDRLSTYAFNPESGQIENIQ